jgi:hypothetical protein
MNLQTRMDIVVLLLPFQSVGRQTLLPVSASVCRAVYALLTFWKL